MYDGLTLPKFFSMPLTVAVEITQKCNLQCEYCCVGELNNEDLSTGDWKRIFNEFVDNKVLNVEITGGEPFLRKDLFEILDVIKDKCWFSIKTNATLITEAIAKRLSEYEHLRGIGISLDGPILEIHDKTRGQHTFDKVMLGIEKLKKQQIVFGLMVTVNKYNCGFLEELVVKAKEIGASNVTINRPMYVGRGKTAECFDFDKEQLRNIALELENLKSKYSGYVLIGEWELLAEINKLKDRIDAGIEDKDVMCKSGCTLGVGSLFIRSNGDTTPCPFLEKPICGSVLESSLYNIWNESEMLQELREKNEKLYKNDCKEKCIYKKICVPGCNTYMNDGNMRDLFFCIGNCQNYTKENR